MRFLTFIVMLSISDFSIAKCMSWNVDHFLEGEKIVFTGIVRRSGAIPGNSKEKNSSVQMISDVEVLNVYKGQLKERYTSISYFDHVNRICPATMTLKENQEYIFSLPKESRSANIFTIDSFACGFGAISSDSFNYKKVLSKLP